MFCFLFILRHYRANGRFSPFLLHLNKLFEQAKLDITPSLKTMEPYMLEALIKEDLKYNGVSSMAEIKKRMKGVPEAEVQKAVYKLVAEQEILPEGAKRNRTYELAKKK